MALQYGESEGVQVTLGGPYGNVSPTSRISEITLNASDWKEATSPFSQAVVLDTISTASKVDLLPTAEQLLMLCSKNIALTTQNDGGKLTVYAIGGKPSATMTIQVCITEVTV